MKALFVIAGSLLIATAAQQIQDVPRVDLHHIMWILDPNSFDAIENNTFLQEEFSGFRKQTTTSGNDQWTAVYLTGEKTHIEFMSANPKFPEGTIGLALGVETQVGDINAIESQLRATWDGTEKVIRDQRTIPWKDSIIPWFDFVILKLGGGNFRTWVMEFDSQYIEQTRPDRPEDWGITREKNNRIHYRSDRLLKNLIGIRLKLDPILLEQEKKTLLALDFQEEKDGDSIVLRRPDFFVRLDPGSEAQFEFSEIEMELNRPYTAKQEVILTNELKLVFDPNLPRAVLRRSSNTTKQPGSM